MTTGVEYLSIDEVARRLGVNHQTVRRWIAKDRLKAMQPAGRNGKWRIKLSDLPEPGARPERAPASPRPVNGRMQTLVRQLEEQEARAARRA